MITQADSVDPVEPGELRRSLEPSGSRDTRQDTCVGQGGQLEPWWQDDPFYPPARGS